MVVHRHRLLKVPSNLLVLRWAFFPLQLVSRFLFCFFVIFFQSLMSCCNFFCVIVSVYAFHFFLALNDFFHRCGDLFYLYPYVYHHDLYLYVYPHDLCRASCLFYRMIFFFYSKRKMMNCSFVFYFSYVSTLLTKHCQTLTHCGFFS